MLRNRILLTTFILVFSAVLAACDFEQETVQNTDQERTRLVAVETITVVRDSFEDYIRVSGVVEAIEDAMISAESSGRLIEIANLGDSFEKNDVIARMDDRLIRAAHQAAKTQFELAEDTYNRLVVLYADSIISTQDYNNARAQRDQAHAQLDQVTKQLEDASITAPFNGRVEERFVRAGELINPGMPVVRLVNTERVKVSAGVPERFSRDIRENTPVRLAFQSNSNMHRDSRISFAGNIIDPDTRTFTIEVEMDNTDGIIKPEMVVDIHVRKTTVENAIVIPRTAVIRDETGTNVFVSRIENGRKVADLVAVRIGVASGPVVEVLDGIEEGDEVVVQGISNLSIGDRLNVLNNVKSNKQTRELQLQNGRAIQY